MGFRRRGRSVAEQMGTATKTLEVRSGSDVDKHVVSSIWMALDRYISTGNPGCTCWCKNRVSYFLGAVPPAKQASLRLGSALLRSAPLGLAISVCLVLYCLSGWCVWATGLVWPVSLLFNSVCFFVWFGRVWSGLVRSGLV